ncbi:type IX secretion system sortase PorU [Psychroflexus aestuariivivens]|uniref:type IX secretion system sortase PorU n=1 Tax=Psychroflexus aestuariivivens TaxID=1795040 RepID=UPI000FDB6F83|nr:type IX secretion system sortase PorU [Psychroflexus aestuariivivens]
MKFGTNLIILLISCVAFSQQTSVQIIWQDNKNVATHTDDILNVPGFNELFFEYDMNSKSVTYSRYFNLNSANYSLSNVQYENVPKSLLKNVQNIPKNLDFSIELAKAGNTTKLALELNPFIEENGNVKRIVSFDLVPDQSLNRTSQITSFSNTNLTNSILSSGELYKFYIEKDGVYRLTFDFLRNLGMSFSNTSSQSLKIYGHGGEMLPLMNSDNEYYDPPELAIQVEDGGDGVFDSGDYILFYGQDTNAWSQENLTNLNLYADRSYYYITNSGGQGKRMNIMSEPPSSAQISITNFDDFQFYEVDETSPSLVGRRWFGDRFDIETEREYEFEFPNLVTDEPVDIRVYGAAISQVQSSMSVSVNGQSLPNINFSANNPDSPSTGSQFIGAVDSDSDLVNINITYNKNGNPAAVGFLDFITLEAKRELIGSSEQFKFKNNEVANLTGVGEYIVQNASGINQIWNITDPINPTFIMNSDSEANLIFKAQLGEIQHYQAVTDNYFEPKIESGNTRVDNQNLKGRIFNNAQGEFQDVDYLIITRSDFISAANRLAQYRRSNDNLNVKVVETEKIFEEFNSGKQDIGAIRNFIKYVYDNASSEQNRLSLVGFIGDASVDYKSRLQGNTNIVPTFQRVSSFATNSSSYMSDDYYAMMDPNEGNMSNSNLMDLAVGRILADTPQRANSMVEKIINSETRDAYASWRNNFVLISDDADDAGDFGLQVDLDELGDNISENKPTINVKKIHSDAFQQITSAGGNRYPDVNVAISDAIEVGTSVVNYFGHGGEDGLAQERIVTQTNAQEWQNPVRYNCFITITCEFSKFDNPLRMTGGELTFWNENGGASSMVTTTRAISVFAGVQFNNEFAPFLFDYDNNDETIAQAVMRAKQNLSVSGKRIVFFVGDPAMKLPLPKPRVRLSSIDDIPIEQYNDTLKALSKHKFSGEIVDQNNQRLNSYNGELTAIVFDKRIERSTLGNDGASQGGELLIMDFTTLGENLFRGKASVQNGSFEFDFVLPKDTRLPVDVGRVSFYSARDNALEEYSGFNKEILIGDINENAPEDNSGPLINLFMNDENFVDGGITDGQPYILANLEDENGINTAGGIGHDIVAILDGDESNPIVLNEYYEAETDDYTRGQVYYRLRDLEEGEHTLTFKAWDVYNNSQTVSLNFTVAEQDDLKITRVLNYPNPFIDYTEFWFNHNRPFEPLEVMVQVFTVTGKLVWTQNQIANTSGFLFRDMTWNGRDDFGNKIGKGVYVYKLTVKSTVTQQKVEKYEKLVIL